MRLASITYAGRESTAVVDSGRVIPLRGHGALGIDSLAAALGTAELDERAALPLAEVSLLPVIPRPGKVVCVGLNYLAHVNEGIFEPPEYPALFPKFSSSLIGAFDPITLPPESSAVDYEGELAVVIGRRCRRVPAERALAAVAGFTVANDVTMRDFQYRSTQWLQGKVWDAATPLGPYLVTPDEVGDAQSLRLTTTVNGQVVQDASTSMMIFDIPTLVSEISVFTTLDPGDVILTGTPAGVGFRREPKLLLADGDTVAVEIERVGRLENRVTAEA